MVRLALLPFDNLTGDASLDWVRTAGPAIVAEELQGSGRVVALAASDMGEATLSGATRLLHCTFSQHAGEALRFEYALEDAVSNRMVETGAVDGAVLFAASSLARKLEPQAKPFSTARGDAIMAWGRGDFAQAVALDPDFGAAWQSWVEQLARSGNSAEALSVADRAQARASLRTPVLKARIQWRAASLRKDDPAQITALTSLVALTPGDAGVLFALAETEQRQRLFQAAAQHFRAVLALQPANADVMNTLGYAEGEAGNIDAARKTLEEYGKLPNQATNSLDSLGEVHFMNGRFADAEKYFTQAFAREPAFLEGRTLLKSAYARWLAGDLAGADAIAGRYFEAHQSQNDATVARQEGAWREAVWLYTTGRRGPAEKKLDSAPASQKPLIDRQRAAWAGQVHFPDDLAQLRTLYFSTNPAADGLARVLYAESLLRAGKNDEAKALLVRWPLPESSGEPVLQSLVFPRFVELRQKLGLK